MQILWLSWRDIKNPASGGAEKVAIEVASRLVKNGTKVTLLTSKFPKAKSEENINGVAVIRRGGLITCRLFAFFYYIHRSNNFDLVLDEINTLPFFTPLYARKKSITLVHQLAKEYWFLEVAFPFNIIGYLLEPIFLRIYKSQKTLALGQSTTSDLKQLGFNNVTTYLPGIDSSLKAASKKEDLLLFIGRLTPAKNCLDAVLAFKDIQKNFPKTKLLIVGSGKSSYIFRIKSEIKKLKLQRSVKLLGFVDEQKKVQLLKKAKIILIPAVREGWALVATEANACGCVPIAYNVPGLRDSIQNGQHGILVEKSPEDLAQATIDLLSIDKKRSKLAENGLKFAKNFNWNNTYEDFKKVLLESK